MTATPTRSQARNVDPNHALRVKRAHDYPEQIWILLASFIGLLTLFHIRTLYISWRRNKVGQPIFPQNEAEEIGCHEVARSTVSPKVPLRRFPVAASNLFRILAYRITVPIGGRNVLNMAEIYVTAGYITALFTWEFVNSRNVTTGVKLDAPYWSDRAANIVATQLPLIVALAGKNNVISFLTGISYEKLNVLHRAAARICLILIWVHFWGRVKQGLVATTSISHPWVRTGIATATAYTLLVMISFRPLRTKFYEFFFFSHFILVLIILIGAYFHIHRGVGFGPYLIPSFVLWALDRFLRLVRVLRNSRTLFISSSVLNSCDATAELLSPSMVRLTVRRNMTWRAGQNAFIIIPGVSRIPFEAHPFTIASIPRYEHLLDEETADSREKMAKGVGSKGENELVFLIQAREGFTRRLRDAAQCQKNKGARVPWLVYVDGPYGSPPDVNIFESIILIAGGSGVSYALPLLQDVVYNAHEGKTACRSVFFLWAVPHRVNLAWISRALYEVLETAPESLQVYIRVHVTQSGDSTGGIRQENASSRPKESPDPDVVTEKLLENDRVTVEIGRPNIYALLEEELFGANGAVSVNVAGPAGLAADVRKALRSRIAGSKAVLGDGPDVTLHIETYGIA